jgi:hypothetical protein
MMVPDTTSETVEAQVENGEEVVVSSQVKFGSAN